MKRSIPAGCILFLLLIVNCTQTISGGGGSDIPNGVTVTSGPDSLSVSASCASIVHVNASNHNPMTTEGYHVVADLEKDAVLNLRVSQPGYYNVVVFELERRNGVFVDSVPVGMGLSVVQAEVHPTVIVSGSVLNKDSGDRIDSAYVYIEGTPFMENSDSEGMFEFRQVPAGNFRIHAYHFEGGIVHEVNVLRDSSEVHVDKENVTGIELELE